MPRGQHRDIPATEAAHFKCKYSFVSLDGKLFLSGKDWHDQLVNVFVRDDFKCRGCGRKMDCQYEWVDVHHVVRRSRGGSDDLSNLILLCRDCHNSQHPEKQTRFSSQEKIA